MVLQVLIGVSLSNFSLDQLFCIWEGLVIWYLKLTQWYMYSSWVSFFILIDVFFNFVVGTWIWILNSHPNYWYNVSGTEDQRWPLHDGLERWYIPSLLVYYIRIAGKFIPCVIYIYIYIFEFHWFWLFIFPVCYDGYLNPPAGCCSVVIFLLSSGIHFLSGKRKMEKS